MRSVQGAVWARVAGARACSSEWSDQGVAAQSAERVVATARSDSDRPWMAERDDWATSASERDWAVRAVASRARPSARESGPSEVKRGCWTRVERCVCDGEGTAHSRPDEVEERSAARGGREKAVPLAKVEEKAVERVERMACAFALRQYLDKRKVSREQACGRTGAFQSAASCSTRTNGTVCAASHAGNAASSGPAGFESARCSREGHEGKIRGRTSMLSSSVAPL